MPVVAPSRGCFAKQKYDGRWHPWVFPALSNFLCKAAAEQWDSKGDKPYAAPSKSYLKAKHELARYHRHIANIRDDWQWKLARELALRYDTIYIEDLTFSGMSRMWGRKTSDLAPYKFFQKLEFECLKHGTELVRRDKFFASTQMCSCCGSRLEVKLKLWDRTWTCPECGAEHDRESLPRFIGHINAAINILWGGAHPGVGITVRRDEAMTSHLAGCVA